MSLLTPVPILKISRGIVDEQKAAQKAEVKRVLDAINAHFASSDSKGTDKSRIFVTSVPVSVGSKAVAEAIKHISQKEKDKSVYLIGQEEGEGARVSHGCHVAEVCLCCDALCVLLVM